MIYLKRGILTIIDGIKEPTVINFRYVVLMQYVGGVIVIILQDGKSVVLEPDEDVDLKKMFEDFAKGLTI